MKHTKRIILFMAIAFLPLALLDLDAGREKKPSLMSDSAETITTGDILERMKNRFEPMIEKMNKRIRVPGLTVAVVHGDQMVYARAFGVKSIETGEPMTTRSLFHQASVTKPFVATAVMQLVELGRIDLDQPVVTYLPYFKLADPRYRDITVRQMLTHSSGMPDVEDYEWEKAVADDGALERYVRSITDQQLIAAPGEKYKYSNMAYEVLGDVIAKVSGLSFEDYVKKHILVPLKMTDTTLLKSEANARLLTTPHIVESGQVKISPVYPYNRMHAPSSTLISNVIDMSRWTMANLKRGRFEQHRILKDATYDTMWTAAGEGKFKVGISWFLGRHGEYKTVSHSGGDTGYRTYLLMMPELGLGIVMASNFDRAPITEIMQTVLHAALGEDYVPRFAREALSLGSDTLDAYAGVYEIRPGLELVIRRAGTKMFMKAPGYGDVEIFAETETKFYILEFPIDMTFEKTDDGTVGRVVVHLDGRDVPAKKK